MRTIRFLWAQRGLRKKIALLSRNYRALEQDINRFKSKTGIKCAEGCGRCCENPDVETTALEMLPLAYELFRKNEAQQWLERAQQADHKGPCIFYQPDARISGNGRCTVYAFRPLICRLFGFSAKSNKHRRMELVTCPVIKKNCAQGIVKADAMIDRGDRLPLMPEYSMKSYQIDPQMGQRQLPINKAIQEAIEHIGLKLKYY